MSDFFVTVPKGFEPLLTDELRSLGIKQLQKGSGGVGFKGELEQAYRVCLWSRVANRVLMGLKRFPSPSPEALYAGIQKIDWSEHLNPNGSLAVDCFVHSSKITHSHYAALTVKDAIVDQFRDRCGERPSVDLERPDLRLNLYLFKNEARLSLDLSGDSLHRRGYREDAGVAPLKENLAAAILLLAKWKSIADQGGGFIDPMCGSGTLPIEAALIAGDIAPGLLGRRFGFETWLGHIPAIWQRLLDEAEQRRVEGRSKLPQIMGSDEDPAVIRVARSNVQKAGLEQFVNIRRESLAKLVLSQNQSNGLIATNPPYGERLGEQAQLNTLYRQLGDRLRAHFIGWHAAVFSGNAPVVGALRLKANAVFDLLNGPLECRLFVYSIEKDRFVQARGKAKREPVAVEDGLTKLTQLAPESSGAVMLVNRLRKNLKHLSRWARRSGVSCYRLYDADLPEYAVAIDIYQADMLWAVVQEYQAPAEVEESLALTRLREALGAAAEVLELPNERLILKQRKRQRGKEQYGKVAQQGQFYQIEEASCRLLVNFTDYVDTGLFLDHRITRAIVAQLAKGKDLLNLFAYTGVASVEAAMAGARSTTTVDLSHTYLDWAKKNLALNGFEGDQHRAIQADCISWLEEQAKKPDQLYGVIFLDPPTFSTSKRMKEAFDIQREHQSLIRNSVKLLAADGVLIFSNNYRRFRLDKAALSDLKIEDISAQTIPEDFKRNSKIHRCWRIARV